MSAPSSSDAAASNAAASAAARLAKLRDYWALTKPEISFLVVVSALAGFLLGAPEGIDGVVLAATLVGTGLCAGGVGVLNHVLERDLDARMRRTADRPLPAGRVSVRSAKAFGALLVVGGVALICPLVNPLTAILAALTALLYLGVYTPLKQVTSYNTLIGTIPGALPALGGYAAATGTLGAAGWSIFAVLVCWQMPHFLSLAWMYRKDYARGGYAMLPVEQPDGTSTAQQMILFTALLFLASLTPVLLGVAGGVYLAGAVPLGAWFLWEAARFYGERTGQQAKQVLKVSIFYIPLLVGLIFVDWLM